MDAITPAQASAYLERWELVRQAEIAELRRTSMELKLRQLASLMAARDAFGAEPQRTSEIQAVQDRWRRLRSAMRG